ncbi:MAG: hypothetical protein GX444_19075 [Myxococcales bacterium]|nr:hypothetical protein [Myxococcales bacterium]
MNDSPRTMPDRKLASAKPWAGWLFLFFDLLAFNALFYCFLKSLLFLPLGYSGPAAVLTWGALFTLELYLASRVRLLGKRLSLGGFFAQAALFLGVAGVVSLLARITPTGVDTDWSWLVPEIIKTPLWFRMFAKNSWLFTGAVSAVILGLMWTAVRSPRSRYLRVIPLAALLLVAWRIRIAFGETEKDDPVLYLVFFAGPVLVFAVLCFFRWYRLAFRAAPIMLHLLLVGLNYIGVLPVNSVYDWVPSHDGGKSYVERLPGATRLYAPTPQEARTSFLFARRIFPVGERLIFSYGPMGMTGIFSLDLKSGAVNRATLAGLVRDLKPSPDGRTLRGVNWQEAKFILLNAENLRPECACDLNPFRLKTPWEAEFDGDRAYISNVTFPILTELAVGENQNPCALTLRRTIDFHAQGYTRFTDGAFDIYVDAARRRLYLLVGMLGGEYQMGLVEVDLDEFRVLRDLRLPAGTAILPVPEKGTLLLPSYYYDRLFEVSPTEMKVRRVIAADPSVFSLAFDPQRNRIYTASRTTGKLAVIDYDSGRTLKHVPIGAKPEALYLDRAADCLYLGSQAGIIRIDLAAFLDAAAQ